MFGLPDHIRACLFDLDGVLTQTATVHAAAWKEMFDAFLAERARRSGEPFVPFDQVREYDLYVDGRQRADGTRTFLQSRGITLPPVRHPAAQDSRRGPRHYLLPPLPEALRQRIAARA